MAEASDDRFAVLRARRRDATAHGVDATRRLLWRAFERGELSDEEFARMVQPLETGRGLPGDAYPHETVA